MRSTITSIRGVKVGANYLASAVLAVAVISSAACSDSTPTAPARSAAVPEAASPSVRNSTCLPDCARILYTHYTSSADNSPEVYSMGADGSTKKKLADGERATWSADHQKIAFVKFSNNATYDIFSMNPDGSAVTQLTFFNSQELDPSWSPDRTKIAFTSDRGGSYDIWVMQANGAVPVRLTTDNLRNETNAAWSPDGKRIAYTSSVKGVYRILITDVTTKVTTVLNTGAIKHASDPAWSPDGTRIAFDGDITGPSCGIHIADVGGSGNVVDFKGPGYGICFTPSFSPDGKRLTWQNLDPNDSGVMIMTANIDGTGGYNGLTFGFPFVDVQPVWGSR